MGHLRSALASSLILAFGAVPGTAQDPPGGEQKSIKVPPAQDPPGGEKKSIKVPPAQDPPGGNPTIRVPAGQAPIAPATREPVASDLFRAWRELVTPDGSRFLLVPTGGPPVVHWVSVTPAGPLEDPRGLAGLSFAVARASLAGTDARGARRPRAERDALELLDTLEQELDQLIAAGEIDEEMLVALESARADAAALFDESAWETAVREAPALGTRLHVEPDGVALQITSTVSAVPRIAQLLVERREGDRLRGVRAALEAVRAASPAAADTDAHRELMALSGLSAGSNAGGSPLSRDRALEVFRRTHHPARTVYVLTGGFEPDTVIGVLEEAFATTRIAPPALAATPPASRAERRATIPTAGAETVAIAMPLPEGASPVVAMALGIWLAGGESSRMAAALAARGRASAKVRATFPFPHRSGGLLMVEVELPAADEMPVAGAQPLVDDVLAALDTALAEAPKRPQLRGALRMLNTRRITSFAGPRALSLRLALDWGLAELSPAFLLEKPRPTSLNELADLARRLRRQSGRAIVVSEVAR